MSSGKTIRFEDLGEPVQKLLRSLHGGKGAESVSADDMSLLEFIAVKDMVKIYTEMSTDRHAEEIWQELKASLLARRKKAEEKAQNINERAAQLEQERLQAEEDARRLAEEQAEADALAEKRKRKEERRRLRAAQAAAEAEEADRQRLEAELELANKQAAEEEAARAAEEEAAQKKREDKKRRREEKARRLREEAEALEMEKNAEIETRGRPRNQKREWDDYVAAHPLEFQAPAPIVMQQTKKAETGEGLGRIDLADMSLLNRTYTPQCPSCHAKYSKPPAEWDCPMCLRKFRQHIKCWQPDDVSNCMCCQKSIGRFTRHHCRYCGRVACGTCTDFKVTIPSLGYKDTPVKACIDCMKQLAPAVVEARKKPQ